MTNPRKLFEWQDTGKGWEYLEYLEFGSSTGDLENDFTPLYVTPYIEAWPSWSYACFRYVRTSREVKIDHKEGRPPRG